MKKKRLIGLDIFRIVAAFIVYTYHAALFLNCDFGIFKKFVGSGSLFMSGFFLLSGFSVYTANQHKNLIDIKELKPFYLKRLAGLMPPYCFITFVYMIFYFEQSASKKLLLAPIEFLGIQSAFPSLSTVMHNGGSWFISCLLLCHILYPFFQEIIKQLSTKKNLYLIATCTVIMIFYPILVRALILPTLYSNPFFRIPEYLIGVALGRLSEDLNRKIADGTIPACLFTRKAFVVEMIALIALITLVVNSSQIVKDCTLYNSITLPLQMAMLLSLSKVEFSNTTLTKWIHYASAISYAFYLVQFFVWDPIDSILNRLGRDDNWLKIILSFVICVGASIILYELIEKPVTVFLKKRLKSNTKENA